MSNITLKTLEKSYKDNIRNACMLLARYMFVSDTDEKLVEARAELERYMTETCKAVTDCGGIVGDVLAWTWDVVNEVSKSSDVEEAIVKAKEDETL